MIIGTMTTMPNRIENIKPTIESILAQPSLDYLEINIPEVCIRTGEFYTIPNWMHMPRVKIFRVRDLGPITKIVSTVERHPEDYIWSCDDDVLYDSDVLENLLQYKQTGTVLAVSGARLNTWSIENNNTSQLKRVQLMEGFGSVLYCPTCFFPDFFNYVDRLIKNEDCRASDDILLSNYFTLHKIPILAIPSRKINVTSYGIDNFSAQRVLGGHHRRYHRVIKYLESEKILSLEKSLYNNTNAIFIFGFLCIFFVFLIWLCTK